MRLLKKEERWAWRSDQQAAFDRVKLLLIEDMVLVYYEPKRPLIVACNSSAYGIGAVVSHKMDDGSERPVCFASRTLSAAEQKYAEIEREALSLVWGVRVSSVPAWPQFHLAD